MAAIFLDGGWETVAKAFVLEFIEPEIEAVADDAINNNAKSALQQVAQRELGGTPRYYILDEQGPDHDKCFKVGVRRSTATCTRRRGAGTRRKPS